MKLGIVAGVLTVGCEKEDRPSADAAERGSRSVGVLDGAATVAPMPSRLGDEKRRFSPEVLASATRVQRQKGKDGLLEMLYAGKCPSWVRGSRSKLREAKDGIVVTVTAQAATDIAEIRERAKYLVEGRSKPPDGTGLCPVHRDATIEARDIDGGSRITARASKTVDLPLLRKSANAHMKMLERTQRSEAAGAPSVGPASPNGRLRP
jgi:hypothetical protein